MCLGMRAVHPYQRQRQHGPVHGVAGGDYFRVAVPVRGLHAETYYESRVGPKRTAALKALERLQVRSDMSSGCEGVIG